MKRIYTILLSGFLLFILVPLYSQNPGDTIKVTVLNYSSNSRDTIAQFPSGNLTFEKIIMKYNMRCKGALVSTGSNTNLGCGEWDYSCNSYIVDSSKIEKVASVHPDVKISNFTGESFSYTSQKIYDYFRYEEYDTKINNILEETLSSVGNELLSDEFSLQNHQHSGKTFLLFTADELAAAGVQAGSINGINLEVENEGADVGFLEIRVKSTTNSTLDPKNPDFNAFQSVFFKHYSFQQGNNRLQFHDVFDWNGTDNIILELSYTNTQVGNQLIFKGSTVQDTKVIYANNQFSADFSNNGNAYINTEYFDAINKELTVSFWIKGDEDLLPTNTSIIWGYEDNPASRDLNIHLPWSNSGIYFDCGFNNGGYDRIDKVASKNQYSGQWNHWAFTKNATTGSMKVFLNGTLFASGSGKTNDISIKNLILGSGPNFANNFKGRIDEFQVWAKALDQAEIADWMNIHVTADHPSYDALVAYYPLDDDEDLLKEVLHDVESESVNLSWSYLRGNNLSLQFSPSDLRPNVGFYQGTYDQEIYTIYVLDSVKREANVVEEYEIISHEGELKHDEVVLKNTYKVYEVSPILFTDVLTGEVYNSVDVTAEGVIEIGELDYFRRYPWYNEIISFVTPYGINLDLGPKGKSWYYDVTDFSPILHNNKRFVMTHGGERQEEMNVEFWFIVGTPVRDVKDFNQIWQGAARRGSATINSITNKTAFGETGVQVPADASAFKIRSSITGHGAQGEFSQNGGTVSHYFNVNGGYEDYIWDITQECSENPIYPQGGTWVYDRQGWCPGERSRLEEYDVTEVVVPGEINTFEYTCTPPANPNGDYRYLVSHQIVSYGDPNFNLDASILEVPQPSSRALYGRINPFCGNPVVLLQNTGSEDIKEVVFEYWLNNAAAKQEFTYETNLDFLETEEVELPAAAMWNDIKTSNNEFHVRVKQVNGKEDDYGFNNSFSQKFEYADIIPEDFIIEIKTNNYPYENSYKLYNENGEVVHENNLVNTNKKHADTLSLKGCFKLELKDTGGDGLNWWANSAQGVGYAVVKNLDGSIIKLLNPDFGGSVIYHFSTTDITGLFNYESLDDVFVYPNPSNGQVQVIGVTDQYEYSLFDMVGKQCPIQVQKLGNTVTIDCGNAISGMYFLQIHDKDKLITKKLIIE